MSSNKVRNLFRSLASRLSLAYTLIFTLFTIGTFSVLFLRIESSILENADGALSDQAREFAERYAESGLDAVALEMAQEAHASGAANVFFRLLDSKGDELAASDMDNWNGVTTHPVLREPPQNSKPAFVTLELPNQEHSVRILHVKLGPGIIAQLGKSLYEQQERIEGYRLLFLSVAPLVVLLAAVIGWVMVRRALEGVERVRQTAAEIAGGSFDARVPLRGNNDELDRLASGFNEMIERIAKLLSEMREMMDNIAHELRSPITRIRGTAELSLTNPSTETNYEEVLGLVVEECDGLLEMINTMLDISESEVRAAEPVLEQIDLGQMIEVACELFQPVFQEKSLIVHRDCNANCGVRGDTNKLQRAIANILDNAIKYTPEGGQIWICMQKEPEEACLTIRDSGPGIPEEDLPRVFERFYRGYKTRSTPGSGLGLSLAKVVVAMHGGTLEICSPAEGGTSIELVLPLSSTQPSQRLSA